MKKLIALLICFVMLSACAGMQQYLEEHPGEATGAILGAALTAALVGHGGFSTTDAFLTAGGAIAGGYIGSQFDRKKFKEEINNSDHGALKSVTRYCDSLYPDDNEAFVKCVDDNK